MSVVTRLNSLRRPWLIILIQKSSLPARNKSKRLLSRCHLSLDKFDISRRNVQASWARSPILIIDSHSISIWNLKRYATPFVQGGNQCHVLAILSEWSTRGCHGYVPTKYVTLLYHEAEIHSGPSPDVHSSWVSSFNKGTSGEMDFIQTGIRMGTFLF